MGEVNRPPEPGLPDDRDWTTVLRSGCEECGYRLHEPSTTADRLGAATERWRAVLGRPGATQRPAPRVWSPVEYGGHCRDLIEVLGERVALMLAHDEPTYEDFDGEEAVRRHEYWRAAPDHIVHAMESAVARTQDTLARVGPDDWDRTGRRGDGYVFTIGSLCRYIVHDVEHHLVDVDG